MAADMTLSIDDAGGNSRGGQRARQRRHSLKLEQERAGMQEAASATVSEKKKGIS